MKNNNINKMYEDKDKAHGKHSQIKPKKRKFL